MKVWKWKFESVKVKVWKWKCKVKLWKCESEGVKVWMCESESVKLWKKVPKCLIITSDHKNRPRPNPDHFWDPTRLPLLNLTAGCPSLALWTPCWSSASWAWQPWWLWLWKGTEGGLGLMEHWMNGDLWICGWCCDNQGWEKSSSFFGTISKGVLWCGPASEKSQLKKNPTSSHLPLQVSIPPLLQDWKCEDWALA